MCSHPETCSETSALHRTGVSAFRSCDEIPRWEWNSRPPTRWPKPCIPGHGKSMKVLDIGTTYSHKTPMGSLWE